MNTDKMMVIITAIYALLTLFICIANIKSAKLSNEQLREMRQEFEEQNKPDVEVELIYLCRAFYGLRFVNRGRHNAEHFKIKLNDNFIESLENNSKKLLIGEKEKECLLAAGQSYDLFFGTNAYRDIKNKIPAKGIVQYQYKGKTYEKEFQINLENYMTMFSVSTDEDKIIGYLKEEKDSLKHISKNIEKLAEILEKREEDK